jgi:hypothetical protein
VSEEKKPGDDDKKRHVPKADTFEGAQPEPVPKSIEFFDWLEALFDGMNQFPEKLAWMVVEGKKLDRPGPQIDSVIYRPKSPKPSREEMVKLCNKIIADCQYDCDVQRRPVTYQVQALHFAKDSDYYARKLIGCAPRPLGSGHPAARENEEDEISAEKQLSAQIMKHQEAMVPLLGQGFEGIIDRMDRIIARQQTRITELELRCNQQADMIERLQSLKEERDRRGKWDDLKLKSTEQGLGMLMSIAPPMLNQIMGKPVVPTNQSLEAITLRNFVNSLKQEQAEALLGKWDNGKLLEPGLLTEDQASIFIYVSLCQMDVDRLDELLPGGPHEITNEQMMGVLERGIAMEQLMPLRILFEGRMKKRMQPPSASPATT